MKLLIAIALGMFASLPASAADQLPPYLIQCLKDGAAQRSARYGGEKKIEVISKFVTEDEIFYQAQVYPPKESQGTWLISVRDTGSDCSFIGDDYVGDAGLYQGLDNSIVKAWTIQDVMPRIEAVGKSKLKEQVRDPSWHWHPGSIEAFKELGIW